MSIEEIIDELGLGDLAIRHETRFGSGNRYRWMRKLTRFEYHNYLELSVKYFNELRVTNRQEVLNEIIEKEYFIVTDSMNLFYRVHSPYLIESVPEPIRITLNKNRSKFY